ncbi:MAG: glycosyltransferase [Ferruginibacter sp.]
MKRILFTVTNDLNYDQRMIRICSSLAAAGYRVQLLGRTKKSSPALVHQSFEQKRLGCYFEKGFAFYAEYNTRLFFYLLFAKADAFCCIDLDTMLPVYFTGKLRGKKLVYDAHEFFSQQKEIVSRPGIYRVWHFIEKTFVPGFRHGYTVSYAIAETFRRQYHVSYEVIMNASLLKPVTGLPENKEKNILYQGAVNEARGLEFLIPAMAQIDAQLHIYGDGNLLEQCKTLVREHELMHKVFIHKKVLPGELEAITRQAYIGLNLVENNGLNQYYSLANKFFDYMHALVPQVTMNFPEYRRINEAYEIAVLIDDLSETNLINSISGLLNNSGQYHLLKQNCVKAREAFNWQNEEKKLISFYKNIFG